ncbi:MAG: bifunctional tetrahydrofolate synthase/dihydrofolate synthase [Pseudomonadales bacterium]
MKRSLAAWLAYAESTHPRSIAMGLERVRQVGQALGVLPWRVPSIIVAGTNGKGSVTAGCERILLRHGHRVGAGFSPHLTHFGERIHVDGEPAAEALMVAGFEAVDAAREATPLTYFEFATLVSLWCWRETGMTHTVLEVGLGGRLDAFNVVDAAVAVVTSIGLDHQEWLGDSREQIGVEKAGVLRPGQAVVLGPDMPSSVLARARTLACRVACYGSDFVVDRHADRLCLHAVSEPWRDALVDVDGVSMDARLAPQNLALAVEACAALSKLRRDATQAAIEEANLPGRMEWFLHANRRIVLDIAHNVDGARFLAERLRRQGRTPRVAVMGNLADKDTAGIATAMKALVSTWIAVPTAGPRGQSAETTADAVGGAVGTPVPAAMSVAAALADALACTRDDDVILVFGSFAVVEAARECLLNGRSAEAP